MRKNFLILMLLALLPLAGFAGELVHTKQYNGDGFQYYIKSMNLKADGVTWEGTVSVRQNIFAGSALTINPTVKIPVEGTVSGTPCKATVEFTVDEIEDDGFKGLTGVTSITIGSNIKTIGTGAFDGCTGVTTITFQNNKNDMTIGENAFKGTKVTELDMTPITGTLDVVEKWWDNSAFTVGKEPADVKNSTLTTIKFPRKVNTIVEDAFAGFSALTTVVFAAQEKTENVVLTMNQGVFQETPIVDLDLTNAKINILNKLFEDNNVTLKTVTMSKWVKTLGTDALANCIQLNSVDFSNSKNLTTLMGGSLSNTVVPTYDFSKCYTLTDNKKDYKTYLNFVAGQNPFVNTTTTTNKNLKEVKLPIATSDWNGATPILSPVTTIGTVFANCEVLTTIVNLENSKVLVVPDGAFENDKSLASLEFPLTLTTVNGSPFAGCEKLATLTFNNQNAALLTIGDGTNNIFGTTLAALKTLNINSQKGITDDTKKTANVTIATDALVGCTGIENLNVAVGGIFAGTINTFAFNAGANATITFGDIASGATLGASLTGPLGVYTSELTIGEYNPNWTVAIVDGTISRATVGQVNNSSVLTALGQAQVIKFAGNITKAFDAPSVPNTALTTLDFGTTEDEDVVLIPAGYIKATVFDETNAPNLTDVTWKPADADATEAFAKKTFADGARGAAAKVTLHTTTAVGDGFYSLDEANLFNVIFDATKAAPTPIDIEVYGNETADYYYGKMQLTKKVAIAKENADGDQVEVYSAFVDSKDQKIYMDRLSLKDGEYVVKADEAVIVRVKAPTTTEDWTKVEGGKKAIVKAYESDKYNTMRYIPKGGGLYTLINNLQVTEKIYSSDYIGTNYVGKTLYAMANPGKVGTLQFDPVAKTSYLPKGALFVETKEASSAAPLEIVWLNEDENMTGIIERISEDNNANTGIFNLQGVRVSNAQKGIYIKNGKKFVVK